MPSMPCAWCPTDTTAICPLCSRPFCREHSGPDGDFCAECSAEDPAAQSKKTEFTKIETTIGEAADDGTIANDDVKFLRPVGEFFVSTTGSISQMSDKELERFYNRYSMLVHDCEAALDRHRVVKSMIAMERDDRERAKLREARAYKAAPSTVKSVVSGMANDKTPSDVKLAVLAALLKRAGVTKEKLQEMINRQKGVKLNGDPNATTV